MLESSFVLFGIQLRMSKYVVLLVVVCVNPVFIYKSIANGEEKSLGTKNMLDQLKNCSPASSCSGSSASSGSDSSCGSIVKRVHGMKTLDSFVKRTEKKVGEPTKLLIHKRTATLVAAISFC